MSKKKIDMPLTIDERIKKQAKDKRVKKLTELMNTDMEYLVLVMNGRMPLDPVVWASMQLMFGGDHVDDVKAIMGDAEVLVI